MTGGLCADHPKHSRLSLIEIIDHCEITDHCNLQCPVCYAQSGPTRQDEPDVVQISGGEPTIRPQFFDVLDYAKAAPIRHLMVNTNGIRIARDEAFAERLAPSA